MLESVYEIMLTDYFKTCLAVGGSADDKRILELFLRIYGVSDEQACRFRDMCSAPELAELTNEHDCNLYYRSCEVLRIRRQENPLTELQQQMIAIKVNAIRKLMSENLLASPSMTVMQLWKNLYGAAEDGIVDALRIGGLLLAEGILPNASHDGQKWLHAAASWMDYTSLLYCVRTPEFASGAPDYVATLLCACDYYGYPYPEPYAARKRARYAQNAYLLIEAVKSDKIEFGRVSPLYYNIIYTRNLSDSDREKLVLRKEYSEEELALLPTDTHYATSAPTLLAKTASGFRAEQFRRAADMYIHRKQSTVGFVCDDEDVLDKAEDMLVCAHRSMGHEHVETINVEHLHQPDFERTVSNVFLRSCINGVCNVLILRLDGKVSEEVLHNVNEFLANKNNYVLRRPAVTLDMSDVLVYCLCDSHSARYVPDEAKIYLDAMTDEEKMTFIREAEEELREELRRSDIQPLSEKTVRTLVRYPLTTARKITEKLFRSTPDGEQPSADLLKVLTDEYGRDKSENNFGFGGYKQ